MSLSSHNNSNINSKSTNSTMNKSNAQTSTLSQSSASHSVRSSIETQKAPIKTQIQIPKLPLSELCANSNKSKRSNNITSNSTFYWIPLTQMDRKFLSTAETALSGSDLKKIKSYCTFLQTIVSTIF